MLLLTLSFRPIGKGALHSTSTTSDFLQKRIAELQSKIGENERRLIEYARDHQIFPLDSGRDIQSDRLAALDRGLLEAENLRKAAEAEYQGALAPGAAAAIVEGGNNLQLSTIGARLGRSSAATRRDVDRGRGKLARGERAQQADRGPGRSTKGN